MNGMAALIQQKFDIYVYDMPWNKRLFGTDRNVSNEIVSHSYKILLNEEEKKHSMIGIHLWWMIRNCIKAFLIVKEKMYFGM